MCQWSGRPRETSSSGPSVLLRGARLQANEDVFVIYYPLSRWGDQLCRMETIWQNWNNTSSNAVFVTHLLQECGHILPTQFQQTEYISVCLQRQAKEVMCTKYSQLGFTQEVASKWPLLPSVFPVMRHLEMIAFMLWKYCQKRQKCPNVSWVTRSGPDTFIRSSLRKQEWKSPSGSDSITLTKGCLNMALE